MFLLLISQKKRKTNYTVFPFDTIIQKVNVECNN